MEANALISELNFFLVLLHEVGHFCIRLSLRGNQLTWIIHVHKMKTKWNYYFFYWILNSPGGLFLERHFLDQLAITTVQGIGERRANPRKEFCESFHPIASLRCSPGARKSLRVVSLQGMLSCIAVRKKKSHSDFNNIQPHMPSARWHFLERTMFL